MSYTDAPKSTFNTVITDSNGSINWNSFTVYPETPMLLDIAAIQYLYGANTTYKTGDDLYTFDTRTPFFKTIWDAGGKDTISVSNFTEDCEINLNAGSFSKITIKSDSTAGYSWLSAPPVPTYDGTNNLCIAYSVVIENVIGGGGNDKLIGNSANNSLDGGSGNDTMYGGDGNDTFDWDATKRAGDDTFYGGNGNDVYVLSSANDVVIEYANEGYDTIHVDFSYSIALLSNIENLYGYGSSNLTLNANGNINYIRGGTGNDVIDGGLGIDYVFYSTDNYSDCLISFNGFTYSIKTKTLGTDTLKNVEYLIFADKTYDLSLVKSSAAYSLTSTKSNYDEGGTAVFNLATTNVPVGTVLSYSISGVSSLDMVNGLLSGTTVVGSDGTASISLNLKSDSLTEGAETLTLTILGNSVSTIINDTSITQIKNEVHSLSVIVNKGVIAADAVLLKGLTENITLTNSVITSHLVQYSGMSFDYNQIDYLITTVVRDGDFTSEFRKEISDLLPVAAAFSYQDVLKLVGVSNIDNVILYVAGADGDFVF